MSNLERTEEPAGTGPGRRLEGLAALVTGAGSGLGRAIAARLTAEGARVACVDRDDAAAVATAEDLSSAVAMTADVSSGVDARRMTERAVEAFGALDIVVANAGIAGPGTAESVDEAGWDEVIAVNLTGVWLTARFAIPHLRRRGGGAIVTIASIAALIGIPGIAAYAAAKGGVVGLTRQMAADLAGDRIRVNAICPGTVPTPLVLNTLATTSGLSTSAGTAEERLGAVAGRYPLGRTGTGGEIAAAVTYLASDEAAWITGHVLPVDGGMTSLARG